MELKFTTQQVANELGNTVAVMAQSSFNIIGAGALLYSLGVYVDNLKAKDVADTIARAMDSLNYGRSSKYALAGAAKDVAIAMVKLYGRPDSVEVHNFWQAVADCDTASDAVAFMVATIKAQYSVTTVQELGAAMAKPSTVGKVEASKADKALKAMEGATPAEVAHVATEMVAHLSPSDSKVIILNLASKLTLAELNEVMALLADKAMLMAEAEAADEALAEAA